MPHTAVDLLARELGDAYEMLRNQLVGLTDEEFFSEPAWRVFWTMIHHDLHHGGEIGALRDLYRATASSRLRAGT